MLMQNNPEFIHAFLELDRTWEVSESTFSSLQVFVCALHGYKALSLEEARYWHV